MSKENCEQCHECIEECVPNLAEQYVNEMFGKLWDKKQRKALKEELEMLLQYVIAEVRSDYGDGIDEVPEAAETKIVTLPKPN